MRSFVLVLFVILAGCGSDIDGGASIRFDRYEALPPAGIYAGTVYVDGQAWDVSWNLLL